MTLTLKEMQYKRYYDLHKSQQEHEISSSKTSTAPITQGPYHLLASCDLQNYTHTPMLCMTISHACNHGQLAPWPPLLSQWTPPTRVFKLYTCLPFLSQVVQLISFIWISGFVCLLKTLSRIKHFMDFRIINMLILLSAFTLFTQHIIILLLSITKAFYLFSNSKIIIGHLVPSIEEYPNAYHYYFLN